MKIQNVQAVEILDSRGNPTLKTFLTLENNEVVWSAVPSGASTGAHEAVELRDKDEKRYGGKGVLKAVKNVNTVIRERLIGQDLDPKKIDTLLIELDGTENKYTLGANAILSVSQAVLYGASRNENVPLWKFISEYFALGKAPSFPRIMCNVVNGGAHASWNFDIQEFMISPVSTTPSTSIRQASEVYQQLGRNLKEQGLRTLVGDEGGYSPELSSNEEVLSTITKAEKDIGYTNGVDIQFTLDAAASEFYKNGKYVFQKTGQVLSARELLNYYLKLQNEFGIISIEDPFAQDDWDGFVSITQEAKDKFIVVGDDLFVTNPKRIQIGVDKKAASALLVKPNQIGTISETMDAITMARDAGYKIVISHRSGETEDPLIADLAYGVGADFLKTGAPCRTDRVAKYNRLLEIEAREI